MSGGKALDGPLAAYGTTIFAEMSGLANEHRAINLSQGFPDFEGPSSFRDAAVRALLEGHNQYARSRGVTELVDAIAAHRKHFYGLDIDPLTEITVTCGATEGIAASILGLVRPGDEVILFEPFYDSYPALVSLAGGRARYATLRFPDFAIDEEHLRSLFSEKTRLVVINTPHNPTGKVWSREELELVARLCEEHDAIVLSDEVYEHLTYDEVEHVSISTLPGMWKRTVSLSSAGKTFSFTGWKVGWAMGAAPLIDAVQSAHQFLTYAVATPLQHAVAAALRETVSGTFVVDFQREYQERRDFLVDTLREVGFEVAVPAGTYFVLADFSPFASPGDRAFAHRLTKEVGVAVIPPSVFYADAVDEGQRLCRFAFCKTMPTLRSARDRLQALSSWKGAS